MDIHGRDGGCRLNSALPLHLVVSEVWKSRWQRTRREMNTWRPAATLFAALSQTLTHLVPRRCEALSMIGMRDRDEGLRSFRHR